VADLRFVRLSPEHRELLETFVCTPSPATEPVQAYLRQNALEDQAASLSATFISIPEGVRRIDAYVTLSVAAWEFPSRFREKLKLRYRDVPSLHLGYIGISDKARKTQKGLGRQIFERIKFEAFQMNSYAGVRLVTLLSLIHI